MDTQAPKNNNDIMIFHLAVNDQVWEIVTSLLSVFLSHVFLFHLFFYSLFLSLTLSS